MFVLLQSDEHFVKSNFIILFETWVYDAFMNLKWGKIKYFLFDKFFAKRIVMKFQNYNSIEIYFTNRIIYFNNLKRKLITK